MRRTILILFLALLAAGGIALYWFTRPLPVLTVTSWPGAYGRAQAAALMRPYAARHRVDVHLAEWDGDLDDLARAVATGSYKGDVIDFELPGAVEACARGLLEPMDNAALPPGADGVSAAQDFVAGALGPCWAGSVVYSQVVIYTPGRFGTSPPAALADFFDLAKFPGRRALSRAGAKFNLEMALLADGVPPEKIYSTLDTAAGLARAFAKLESIASVTLWVDSPARIVDLVRSGQAALGTALNGDVYDAARHGAAPGIVWDRQLYELDVFAVPKGDPKAAMAMDFVRYATGSVALARVADWVPYGPARRSSWALVGKNPELGIAMTPWLPTTRFKTAFAVDDGWWRVNGPRIAPLWRDWARLHAH